MNEATPPPTDAPVVDEQYYARISSLLDGEFERDQLLETLDFLVGTKDARQFYANARALQGLVEGAEGTEARATVRPDPTGWASLRERLHEGPQRAEVTSQAVPFPLAEPSPTANEHSGPSWAMGLAAAALLATVGWLSVQFLDSVPKGSTPQETATVQESSAPQLTIGAEEGHMTDSRFIELATEIVEADRKYREEMLALMTAIQAPPMVESTSADTGSATSSIDQELARQDRREGQPAADRNRVRLW